MAARALIAVCLAAVAAGCASAQAGKRDPASGLLRLSPGDSLDAAYRDAEPGEVVELAAGDYGDHTIELDAAKPGPRVVFRPAPGARVTLGEVTVYARHLELRDMRTKEWTTKETAQDVVFRNVSSRALFVHSSRNISVIGGQIGPGRDFDSQIAKAAADAPTPRKILLDGVFFKSWRLTPGSDAHVECLQVGEIDGLVIRNSRFDDCETHNVFISPWYGGPIRNVLLENNMGGRVPGGYYGFRVAAAGAAESCANVVLRYNSALAPFLVECAKGTGVRMVANVGPYREWLCRDNIRYERNVFDGTKCGKTDLNAKPGFVDPKRFDLHLSPKSRAIDRGKVGDAPARDIDGHARPRLKPDAGADERRSNN